MFTFLSGVYMLATDSGNYIFCAGAPFYAAFIRLILSHNGSFYKLVDYSLLYYSQINATGFLIFFFQAFKKEQEHFTYLAMIQTLHCLVKSNTAS